MNSRLKADNRIGSVILPVDQPAIHPDIHSRLIADGFRLKSEFHITLVTAGIGRTMLAGAGTRERILNALEPVTILKPEYEADLYHIDKPKEVYGTSFPRPSLVAKVTGSTLGLLVEQAWRQIAVPPPPLPILHVTIATQPPNEYADRGIGIDSSIEWAELKPQLYAHDWQPTE